MSQHPIDLLLPVVALEVGQDELRATRFRPEKIVIQSRQVRDDSFLPGLFQNIAATYTQSCKLTSQKRQLWFNGAVVIQGKEWLDRTNYSMRALHSPVPLLQFLWVRCSLIDGMDMENIVDAAKWGTCPNVSAMKPSHFRRVKIAFQNLVVHRSS